MPPTDKGSLALAMLAFQSEAPRIQRDSINPHFKNKYVSLDKLVAEVLPALNKHGIVVTQSPCVLDGQPALRTVLRHAATNEEELETTMLLMAAKNTPQEQGSAITYARRYSLMAMLGLVADPDDDDQKASVSRAARQQSSEVTNGSGELVSEKQAKFIDWQLKRLDAWDRENDSNYGEQWRARMRKEFMTSDPALIAKSPNLRSFVDELKSVADALEGDGA